MSDSNKNQQLKKVIKTLVRECLLEVFAEMKLENIVESVLSKQQTLSEKNTKKLLESSDENSTPSLFSRVNPASKPMNEDRRAKIKEAMGLDDNTWNNVYGNIATPNEGEIDGKPQLVTEEQLLASGLIKDYSKYIK